MAFKWGECEVNGSKYQAAFIQHPRLVMSHKHTLLVRQKLINEALDHHGEGFICSLRVDRIWFLQAVCCYH